MVGAPVWPPEFSDIYRGRTRCSLADSGLPSTAVDIAFSDVKERHWSGLPRQQDSSIAFKVSRALMGGGKYPEAHSRKLRARFAEYRRQGLTGEIIEGKLTHRCAGLLRDAAHHPETYTSCTATEAMNQALG